MLRNFIAPGCPTSDFPDSGGHFLSPNLRLFSPKATFQQPRLSSPVLSHPQRALWEARMEMVACVYSPLNACIGRRGQSTEAAECFSIPLCASFWLQGADGL